MSVYLDNAATSFPKPEEVYQAVIHAMREVGASPGRGGHHRSLEAGRIMFMAREAVARLFSIADSSRIIFTHNATGALNLALHGTLKPGDHVITTSMEHNSLLRPLHALGRDGVDVTIVDAGPEGLVDPDQIARFVRKDTRMIAVGHISNVCGAIQPIDRISAICHKAGAMFLMDAAQSAGYINIDVVSSGIDLLAAPGHKGLLGPPGTGLLYVAPHIELKPIFEGGTGTSSTSLEQPLMMPDGYEAGTHNLPGIAGLKAGIEFILDRGIDTIFQHEHSLVNQAARLLGLLPGVKIYGPGDPESRGAVLSFNVEGVDASLLAAELDHGFDIAVRAGLHCAPLAHRTIGTLPGGTLRMSPGWSSTSEEIAFFSDAVVQCVGKIKESM
ncbi:MAG: cysteine desulfurase [Geobacteraceae bacterium GWC2_55_20]|nr:MAG: cysteine desulfurase [Geobacteraceae bacterium GWC2_55_20]HCE66230.1 cysteine desulfurase [Geobacter sp.]